MDMVVTWDTVRDYRRECSCLCELSSRGAAVVTKRKSISWQDYAGKVLVLVPLASASCAQV